METTEQPTGSSGNSKLAQTARSRATKALIDENKERYEVLVRQERLALGLSPYPGGKTPEQREEQIRKLEERLAKLRAED
jgi:hypothetical protein